MKGLEMDIKDRIKSMLYVNEGDIERCMSIVSRQLAKANVNIDDCILKEITIDIMNISYSKGGDYSNDVILRFAKTYIAEGFYMKFIDK